jgi:hypothetical protein
MMAGFREFAAGEPLTATNVDDFLMKQSVMKFADGAARDAALGTAVASGNALREGMVAYLDDTDEVIKYDGTDWTSIGEASGLVAVKHALFTGTQTGATATNLSVTNLSIVHETADAANNLIISAFIGVAACNNGRANVGIGVHDGTNLIAIGDTAGSRNRVSAGGMQVLATSNLQTCSPSITFVHTPGAGSKTYTVRAINIASGTQTLFINRSEQDGDTNVNVTRGVSALVIQEVKV